MDVPNAPNSEILERVHRIASHPSSAPDAPETHDRSPLQSAAAHLAAIEGEGPLTFRGQRVEGFTTGVGKKRASFNNIKQKLRAANVRYGLFPARLQLSFDSKRHSFLCGDHCPDAPVMIGRGR